MQISSLVLVLEATCCPLDVECLSSPRTTSQNRNTEPWSTSVSLTRHARRSEAARKAMSILQLLIIAGLSMVVRCQQEEVLATACFCRLRVTNVTKKVGNAIHNQVAPPEFELSVKTDGRTTFWQSTDVGDEPGIAENTYTVIVPDNAQIVGFTHPVSIDPINGHEYDLTRYSLVGVISYQRSEARSDPHSVQQWNHFQYHKRRPHCVYRILFSNIGTFIHVFQRHSVSGHCGTSAASGLLRQRRLPPPVHAGRLGIPIRGQRRAIRPRMLVRWPVHKRRRKRRI